MTLENIKEKSTEIIKTKNIIEKYREQVEQLENEIEQLEKEVSKTLDFEKDVELQEKKESLPKFKQRLEQAERKNKEDLRIKGLSLISVTTRYQNEEMAIDKQVVEAYQTAKKDLSKAYESIEAYELEREKKADVLAETVAQAGYTEAVDGLGVASTNDSPYMVLHRSQTKFNLTAYNQTAEQFFNEVLDK